MYQGLWVHTIIYCPKTDYPWLLMVRCEPRWSSLILSNPRWWVAHMHEVQPVRIKDSQFLTRRQNLRPESPMALVDSTEQSHTGPHWSLTEPHRRVRSHWLLLTFILYPWPFPFKASSPHPYIFLVLKEKPWWILLRQNHQALLSLVKLIC